jgi:decaprenylphospho-beta-D-ribofuranose 2-oxidase
MVDVTTHSSDIPVMDAWLPSLDGTENVTGQLCKPDRTRALYQALKANGPMIARGGGLSYCNAGAGRNCRIISSLAFNRILAFDPDNNLLTVEPGMNLGDLFEFVTARNRYFPVLPGHPAITVGGCTAFNVHGKTQHNVGNFIDFVEKLTLFHPAHGECTCSREDYRDLFFLTVGGFGTTGYITSVTLRLLPLKGHRVRFRKHKAASLNEAVEIMTRLSPEADVLYSWNDLNRRGEHFGQGLVFSEQFLPGGAPAEKPHFHRFTPEMRRRLMLNFYCRLTAHIECSVYYAMESLTPMERECSLKSTAFPIHGKEIYYLLFGRQGLREYQMLFPHETWHAAAADVQALTEQMPMPMTLGSMKFFSGKGDLLNFRGDGICLVIDVPANRHAVPFFNRLDEIVIRHGGVVNLSKDSRLTAETAQKIFPEYEQFKQQLHAFDPEKRFMSALRKRMHV